MGIFSTRKANKLTSIPLDHAALIFSFTYVADNPLAQLLNSVVAGDGKKWVDIGVVVKHVDA